MIRRSTKIQLALFVLITLLGISYVSAEYIGVAKYVTGDDGCTIKADFASSGGAFSNGEVTYRGVTVGKVGGLHLVSKSQRLPSGGVEIDLELDNCSSPKIPADITANVANRSVVGEQYINLVPVTGAKANGPVLKANAVIPLSRTSVPTPTEKLLVDLNDLIESVPLKDLKTTITELGNAFSGRGNDLGSLLDSTNTLLNSALQKDNLGATLSLIRDSSTVLQTQLDVQAPLQSWTHSLNLLSQQLKKSDPDFRRLLDDGPTDLNTVSSFIQTNRSDLAVTLNNLITTNTLLVNHLDGLQQVFELYPALAAGGAGVLQNNEGKLALILQATPDPQDCGTPKYDQQGYNGTVRRTPDQIAAIAPNVSVRCTASNTTPVDGSPNPTNVRGSANVPGGDPISLGGNGQAYPRVSTSNTKATAKATTKAKVYDSLQVGPTNTGKPHKQDVRYVSLLADALR